MRNTFKNTMICKVLIFTLFIGLFGQNSFANDTDYYLVIIGGGTTQADALKAKELYEKQDNLRTHIKSKVEILLSDSIKGLNPGFNIATIGYCISEDYADLVVKTANSVLSGVYSRKVQVPLAVVNRNYIILKLDKAPFEGELFQNSGSDVVVNTTQISFTEKKGSFDVRNYLAWYKKSGVLRYLSELDFSRLFAFEDNVINCNKESSIYSGIEGDPWSGTEMSTEECEYVGGIKSVTEVGIESDSRQISFPISSFTFREVLFYYIQSGYFEIFLKSEFKIGENGSTDYVNYEFKEDKIIMFEPGAGVGIYVKGGYIVFYSESGA